MRVTPIPWAMDFKRKATKHDGTLCQNLTSQPTFDIPVGGHVTGTLTRHHVILSVGAGRLYKDGPWHREAEGRPTCHRVVTFRDYSRQAATLTRREYLSHASRQPQTIDQNCSHHSANASNVTYPRNQQDYTATSIAKVD